MQAIVGVSSSRAARMVHVVSAVFSSLRMVLPMLACSDRRRVLPGRKLRPTTGIVPLLLALHAFPLSFYERDRRRGSGFLLSAALRSDRDDYPKRTDRSAPPRSHLSGP